MIKREIAWTWTNWTIGVWYCRFGKYKRAWGIDIGPFEIAWRESVQNVR
jgi:hypothetical protein